MSTLHFRVSGIRLPVTIALLCVVLMLTLMVASYYRLHKPEERLSIAVSALPYFEVATRLVGDRAEVVLLDAQGEIDVSVVQRADVIVFTHPSIDTRLAETLESFDVSEKSIVLLFDGNETYISKSYSYGWLDIHRLLHVVERLSEVLGMRLPDYAEGIHERSMTLVSDLRTIDADIRSRLSDCPVRTLLQYPENTFQSFADAFGLTIVSTKEMTRSDLLSFASINKIHTVFVDSNVEQEVNAFVADLGLDVVPLNPYAHQKQDAPLQHETFEDVMRINSIQLQRVLCEDR